MAFTTKFEMKGVAALMRNLDLSKKQVKKALRKGLTKAGRIMAKAAKAKLRGVPGTTDRNPKERTKLLEKSISAKVSVKGKKAFAIIGPAHGFRQQVGTRKRQGTKSDVGDPIYEDPANIAHLVEYGHGGPHPAPPHPFLRPAYDQTKDQCLEIIGDAVAQGFVEMARD